MASAEVAKIKLYTNYGCPWAGRVHIALGAQQIPFEEEQIDLKAPRTPEYLAINPRGKVPALAYNGEILTESAVIAQFIADLKPDGILPASGTPAGALERARVNWIVSAYFDNVNPQWNKLLSAKTDADAEAAAEAFVQAVVKEVEPHLKSAAPYFDGSKKITLVEVLTGPFLLRFFSAAKHGLIPSTLVPQLAEKAPKFSAWAQATISNPTVISIYNEDKVVAGFKERIAKARAA